MGDRAVTIRGVIHILVPSFIFILSRDLIFHDLNILRGRGKSRIDPGSEDGVIHSHISGNPS